MGTSAIVLAAGSGSRFGGDIPKQLVELGGVPLVIRSVQAFANHPSVDHVVVVTQASLVGLITEMLERHALEAQVIVGGDTRDASSRAALALFAQNPAEKLLIHDAVRALIDADTIQRCVDALDTHQASVAVALATDTIFEVQDDQLVAIPDRSRLRRAQTPQAARAGLLAEAFAKAAEDAAFVTTDDIGVIHRYLPETAIALVEGSPNNIKITTPQDLLLAQVLLP